LGKQSVQNHPAQCKIVQYKSPEHKHSGRTIFKPVGKIKLPSVKFVIDYFRFDIAEYNYDNQLALSTPKFKEKCFNSKTAYVIENIIINLIAVFNVNI
jgi:hypothetical protein